MARIIKPLTELEIKNAKPKEKEYTLYDGDNLNLSIRPSGKKVWLFPYKRPTTGKRAKITIGGYPEISLAQARKKRQEFRSLLANKIDPQEELQERTRKAKEEAENTIKIVATKWLEVKRAEITADYAEDIMRSLELHVFPELGDLPITRLTAPLAISALKPVAAKGSLETVKRLCQRLNEIVNYAINVGLVQANPIVNIKTSFRSPKKENMPTIEPSELPSFMKTLSRASIKITTRCLIEWQLHTITRPSEAAGARWEEIDLENKLWTIPAERMKKRREHHVPLTPQTLEILEILKPISGHREFLFPADRDPKKHTNSQTANAAIKRMGYGGKLVSHGLRALASTTLNEQGFDPDVIEASLAHVDKNSVRRAYNRSDYLERRRKLMDWWSEYIERTDKGLVPDSHADIVFLRAV